MVSGRSLLASGRSSAANAAQRKPVAMSTVAKAAALLDNACWCRHSESLVVGGHTATALMLIGAVGVDGVNGAGVAAAGGGRLFLLGPFGLLRGRGSILPALATHSAGCVGGFARPDPFLHEGPQPLLAGSCREGEWKQFQLLA